MNKNLQNQDTKKDNKSNTEKLIYEKACKGASELDFRLFLHVVNRTGLDPLMNQIYAVCRKVYVNGSWEKKFTPQTSIDGLRILADKTGKYSPGDICEYSYDENNKIKSVVVSVKKQTPDGTWHDVKSIAFWDEYVQKDKEGFPTKFWSKFSHLMIAKCAEALALRKAFPAELCNLYTNEEMAQESNTENKENNLISENQVLELTTLINGNEELLKKALKALNIKDLSQVPLNSFEGIKKALNKQIDQINNKKEGE